MDNFYEYISSDFNINPKKSIQELILNGTLYNAPKSLSNFIQSENKKDFERETEEKKLINNKTHIKHFSVNDEFVYKSNDNRRNKVKTPSIENESRLKNINVKYYVKTNYLLNRPASVDFSNPNQVIKAVENEFKKVKIIPKNESFITQLGEFKQIKLGQKKFRYEEATLKNINVKGSSEEQESKKKKKLLEYVIVS